MGGVKAPKSARILAHSLRRSRPRRRLRTSRPRGEGEEGEAEGGKSAGDPLPSRSRCYPLVVAELALRLPDTMMSPKKYRRTPPCSTHAFPPPVLIGELTVCSHHGGSPSHLPVRLAMP